MTREEMLKQMGLTHEELKDFLLKLAQLRASLNERQQAVLDHSLPTPSKAARTFGADVTAADLERLLRQEVHGSYGSMCVVAILRPNK